MATLKRLPRAVRWLIAAIALALGVVAAAGIANWRETRAVERVALWNEAPRGRRLDAPIERKPLCGPVIPGNAWDDYMPACRELLEVNESISLWWNHNDRHGFPETTAADVVKLAGEPLRLLHQGSRRATAHFPAGESNEKPWLALESLGAEAEVRLASGDLDGAIDSWATALQFDLDRMDETFKDFSVFTGLNVSYRLLQEPGLTRLQAARIGALAEAAEIQLPHASDLLGISLASKMRHEIELAREAPWGTPADWLSRWGSSSTYRAQVLLLQKYHEGLLKLAAQVEDGPVKTSLSRVKEFELEETPDDLDDHHAWQSEWKDHEDCDRQMRAELRLIRAGALVRQGKDQRFPGWPCDPCDLQPLSTEAAAGGFILISTRPFEHCQRTIGDAGGGWGNTRMEIAVPR